MFSAGAAETRVGGHSQVCPYSITVCAGDCDSGFGGDQECSETWCFSVSSVSNESCLILRGNTMARYGLMMAALSLAVCGGCGKDGPEKASVSGTVTYNGEPIPRGVVAFIPAEGTSGPTAGGSVVDGEFDIDDEKGPVLGKHLVSISGTRPTGRMVDVYPVAAPGKVMREVLLPLVPGSFGSDPKKVVTIESGHNDLELVFEGPEMSSEVQSPGVTLGAQPKFVEE